MGAHAGGAYRIREIVLVGVTLMAAVPEDEVLATIIAGKALSHIVPRCFSLWTN